MRNNEKSPKITWAASQKINTDLEIGSVNYVPKPTIWNDASPFSSLESEGEHPLEAGQFTVESVSALMGFTVLSRPGCAAVLASEWADFQPATGMHVTLVSRALGPPVSVDAHSDLVPTEIRQILVDLDLMDGNRVLFIVGDIIDISHSNYLLIESNTISITNFCSALECINMPILNDWVAGISFHYSHPAIAVGTVVHGIIQACLLAQSKSLQFVISTARRLVAEHEESIYACGLDEREFLNEVLKRVKSIMAFLDLGMPLSAVEQGVYSRVLGLKGSIDCSGPGHVVEIKAGKSKRISHRAQVLMYSLMMKAADEDNGGAMRIHNSNTGYIAYNNSNTGYNLHKSTFHAEHGDNILHKSTFHAEHGDNILHKSTFHAEHGDIPYKPMLYYVEQSELASVEIRESEIASLLRLRNRLSSMAGIGECYCPEDRPCRIYQRIKALGDGHFLRQQLDGIEAEYQADIKYTPAIAQSNADGTAMLRFAEECQLDERVGIYTRRKKFITYAVVERVESTRATVRPVSNIPLGKAVMVGTDRCDIFYSFMRWALLYLAYPKYCQNLSPGGLAGFMLPGEENKDTMDCIMDCIMDCTMDSTMDCTMKCTMDSNGNNKENSNGNKSVNIDGNKLVNNNVNDMASDSIELNTADLQSDCLENDSMEKDGSCSDLDSILLESSNGEATGANGLGNEATAHNPLENEATAHNPLVCHQSPTKQPIISHPSVLPFLEIRQSDSFCYYTPQQSSPRYSIGIPSVFQEEFSSLNEEQQCALFYALNCEKYKVVHGMPGTGKSTLIGLLVRILLHSGKKVLVVCYTNLAIDNIITKLGSTAYYRAGTGKHKETNQSESRDNSSQSRIMDNSSQSRIRENANQSKSKEHTSQSKPRNNPSQSNHTSNQSLKEAINAARLVCGTCFCFRDPVFIQNQFDYCVIDEGSQMHLLLSMIPISLSARFCVVGDHLQLRPLTKCSRELGVSIFEHLMGDCIILSRQYRMNADIMRLANRLFYDGRLICGIPSRGRAIGAEEEGEWWRSGNGTLMLDGRKEAMDRLGWALQLSNGNTGGNRARNGNSVIFIDTAGTSHLTILKGMKEATVLCYFNATVSEVKKVVSGCYVTTIDKFQGSEATRVVVVFDPVKHCEVLESRERLNVALTRAKCQLILVGNRRKMEEVEVLKELLAIL